MQGGVSTMKNSFAYFLEKYFTNYLINMRNLSKNTISSYRDTMVLLLNYLINVKNIKIENIQMASFSYDMINEFITWLEKEQNVCTSTCNQRLAAIHSFFRYVSTQCPELLFLSQQILSISNKKTAQKEIKYLSSEQVKELLSIPDIYTRHGLRDLAILSLLYDSGCRVQELVDLRIKDVKYDTLPQVTLTGKGNKTRTVPLMMETGLIIKKYIEEIDINYTGRQNEFLFFNLHREKFTRQGITYILKKYASDINLKYITPHILRHSKAMHLTEAEVNPIYIRDFLGHSDFKTTQIYSKTSVELKRKALEKLHLEAIPDIDVKNANVDGVKKDWTNDKPLLEWLSSLSR